MRIASTQESMKQEGKHFLTVSSVKENFHWVTTLQDYMIGIKYSNLDGGPHLALTRCIVDRSVL